ncbi:MULTISPECIES: HK97-gp10 family putative phage morphogenesis protein [unclassified Clostridium]|uniref:HK97-gp10 family putative phage morphogenesis protein n=1 Tax=unclassified Clostridium TaxID=2614128 RepID=UPI003216593A
MAKLELEGMEELIDRVNKLGEKGEVIKKKALDKAGELVKEAMETRAPKSEETKRHMSENIQVSEIQKENGVDFIKVGPNKGDNSEFFYSKFTEWGTSKIPAQHWAEKSVLENKREINETIKTELQRGIEE